MHRYPQNQSYAGSSGGGGGGQQRAIRRLPPTFQPILGRGGVWGQLKGRGAPGPQHVWLKMTPLSR